MTFLIIMSYGIVIFTICTFLFWRRSEMRPPTYARKVDRNHGEIRDGLRAEGFSVVDTSAVGGGFPDLVVFRDDTGMVLLEVKDGHKPPSGRKLTEAQVEMRKRLPFKIVTSLLEALFVLGVTTKNKLVNGTSIEGKT